VAASLVTLAMPQTPARLEMAALAVRAMVLLVARQTPQTDPQARPVKSSLTGAVQDNNKKEKGDD